MPAVDGSRPDGGVVGLVPAAGGASRLGKLPCSKEVLPVGLVDRRVVPACQPLLTAFARAGIQEVFCLLRPGKWDIPQLLGSGRELGLHLAYLVVEASASVPETLVRALPFVRGRTVALGFPDIHFRPEDAFVRLLERHAETGAEAVLGCFPTAQEHKTDMVELDAEHAVRRILIKRRGTGLAYAWSIAVWGPRFSERLETFVTDRAAEGCEPFVGDVLEAAITDGGRVVGVPFPEGTTLDLGTPEDLARAWRAAGEEGR